MVSPRLKKHAADLAYLQRAKPCIRKHLIQKADRSLVECFCEVADNILKGNLPLTPKQKVSLKKNKSGLRTLAKKSESLKKKKTVLQKGGFLGSLLAPLVSVVGPLLSNLLQ